MPKIKKALCLSKRYANNILIIKRSGYVHIQMSDWQHTYNGMHTCIYRYHDAQCVKDISIYTLNKAELKQS